jgi:hypothetical protein
MNLLDNVKKELIRILLTISSKVACKGVKTELKGLGVNLSTGTAILLNKLSIGIFH